MGPLKENPTGYGGFHTLWAFLSHSKLDSEEGSVFWTLPFFDRHEVLVKACVDCGDVIHSMVESRILTPVYKDAPRPLSFYFVPLTVTPVYKYKDAPGNQIGQIVNLLHLNLWRPYCYQADMYMHCFLLHN